MRQSQIGIGCLCLICILLGSCKSSKKISQKTPGQKGNIYAIGKVVVPSDARDKNKTTTFVPEPKNTKLIDNVPLPPYDFKDEGTIKKVQMALYLSNYSPGRINGLWNELTEEALARFQKNNGLPAGDRGDVTLRALGFQHLDFSIDSLQKTLHDKGFDAGPVDGIMGGMTRGAYIDFLTQNNLGTGEGISLDIKRALFSTDNRYHNKTREDVLFNEKNDIKMIIEGPFQLVFIADATIKDIQEALLAWGYDPGPRSKVLTLPTADALFRYQLDRALPMGGFNRETLKSMGFKE